MGWRIGALGSVVALVVIALGVVGQSAFAGPSATTLVDGTTDSITNLDPAGAYDYGTQTLMGNVYEHLLDFKHGPKLEPSLATRCFSVGTLATWRCNLRRGVEFSQCRQSVFLELSGQDAADCRNESARRYSLCALSNDGLQLAN